MSFALIRVCVLGGALMLIAGCGGSSGGGSGSGGSGGGGNPTTVTFTVTGGTPTAVATSTGTGSFTAATLTAGKLTLDLPSGTTNFAVAFVCPPVSLTASQVLETFENVFEASTLDGTSFSQSCPTTPTAGSTGTLTGAVDANAIAGASFLNIDAENGTAQQGVYEGTPSGNFSFAAPVGTDRVAVLAYDSVLSGFEQFFSLVAVKNFSSQTVPGTLNGGNTVVLGAADQTTPEPLTYKSVPPGYNAPSTLVSYEFSGGDGFIIANGVTSEYPSVPAGAAESGDDYIFMSAAGNAANALEQASVSTFSSSAGPVSVTFPPAWSYVGPTPAARPSFDLSYPGFSGQTGVHEGVGVNWFIGTTAANFILVTPTGNYLNGSTTIAIPDLSSLTGFLAPPASGTLVEWSAEISQGSFPSLQPLPPNGTVTTVSNAGNYIVP